MNTTSKKAFVRPPKRTIGRPRKEDSFQHGLTAVGKLPKKLYWLQARLNQFRRNLEEAVIQSRGAVSLTDASLINSAVKWERHSSLAGNWLRINYDELTVEAQLKFSDVSARASDMRDRAIRKLDLDANAKASVLTVLYDKEDRA